MGEVQPCAETPAIPEEDAALRLFPGAHYRLVKLLVEFGVEGIALGRAVETDYGDLPLEFIGDHFIAHLILRSVSQSISHQGCAASKKAQATLRDQRALDFIRTAADQSHEQAARHRFENGRVARQNLPRDFDPGSGSPARAHRESALEIMLRKRSIGSCSRRLRSLRPCPDFAAQMEIEETDPDALDRSSGPWSRFRTRLFDAELHPHYRLRPVCKLGFIESSELRRRHSHHRRPISAFGKTLLHLF